MKLLHFLLPFIIIFTTLSSAAPKKSGKTTFRPKITSVSAESITVTTGRNKGLTVTGASVEQGASNVEIYKITPYTNITVNGLPATASDLEPGMAVLLTQGINRDTAATIIANNTLPSLKKPKTDKKQPSQNPNRKKKGIVFKKAFEKITPDKIVDISSEVITVGTPSSKVSAYRLKPNTEVELNGDPSDINSIKIGMLVKVTLFDQTTVRKIEAYDAE